MELGSTRGLHYQRHMAGKMSHNGSRFSAPWARCWTRVWPIVLAAFVVTAFVVRWEYGFISDFALIGLMAKRLLEFGEVPLFVWGVGYQGVLVEVPAVALAFKLFGISPIVLNLVPAVFTLAFFATLRKVLEISYGLAVAGITTALTVISTPLLYFYLARTQPNYSEVYTLGLLLIWGYLGLLKGTWAGQPRRHRLYRLALLGGLAGFGFYLYGQIAYFVGAVLLHAGLLGFRATDCAVIPLWRRILWPASEAEGGSRSRMLPRVCSWSCAAIMGLGIALGAWCEFVSAIRVGRYTLQLVHFLALSALCWVAAHALSWTAQAGRRLLAFWPETLVAVLGFALGLAPKVFYTLILHGKTVVPLRIGGDGAALAERSLLAVQSMTDLTNLSLEHPLSVVAAVVLSVSAVAFALVTWTAAHKLATGVAPGESAVALSPVALLPVVALPLFLASVMTTDRYCRRYLLVLVVVVALALGHTAVALWGRFRSWIPRAAVVASVALVLLSNARAVGAVLARQPDIRPMLDTLTYLRAEGVTRAYGDYWKSYTLAFLSREEIVVEPLGPSYSPYYRELVAAAERIALIEDTPKIGRSPGSRIGIRGLEYSVERTKVVGDHYVSVLRKL